MAVTYDFSNNVSRVYVNGVAAGVGTAQLPLFSIPDVNNWLGRSNWTPLDSYLNATCDEFRIYDTALSPVEVLSSFKAGQNPSNPAGSAASITLAAPSILRVSDYQELKLTGIFGTPNDLDLTFAPGTTYTSSDASILSIPAKGMVVAQKPGQAQVTASYGGKQSTVSITVKPVRVSHRYSFNEPAGETLARNRNLTGDGQLLGGAVFTGTGSVRLDGMNGYVDLPNRIISGKTNTTVEAWVTWNGRVSDSYSRIFDFGTSLAGEDQNNGATSDFLFVPTQALVADPTMHFYSRTARHGPFRNICVFAGGFPYPMNAEVHLAIVFDYVRGAVGMYTNGTLAASGPLGGRLSDIDDVNCWLGKSQYPDPFMNGQFNEFRVYSGALSAGEILQSFRDGPDHDGALDSIDLEIADQTLAVGETENAVVFARYIKKSSEVTASASFTALDPEIASVDNAGKITALKSGTARIRAAYQGFEDTQSIRVFQPVAATMKHRYPFTEAAGERIAHDIVGTAHGDLAGDAEQINFSGGGLLGFAGSGGYVNLPNGLLSAYESFTIETWFSWGGPDISGNYLQRLFDFGNNSEGEDLTGTAQTFFALSPYGGSGGLQFLASTNGIARASELVTASPEQDRLTHVAVTYDFYREQMRLYVDGQPILSSRAPFLPSAVRDVNNWIGRSNSQGEGSLVGKVDEFRIYEGTMTDEEVAASFTNGPDAGLAPASIRIRSIEKKSNGALLITIESSLAPDRHRLQQTLSLSAPNWSDVDGVTFQAGNNAITVETPGSAPRQFFRVHVP